MCIKHFTHHSTKITETHPSSIFYSIEHTQSTTINIGYHVIIQQGSIVYTCTKVYILLVKFILQLLQCTINGLLSLCLLLRALQQSAQPPNHLLQALPQRPLLLLTAMLQLHNCHTQPVDLIFCVLKLYTCI